MCMCAQAHLFATTIEFVCALCACVQPMRLLCDSPSGCMQSKQLAILQHTKWHIHVHTYAAELKERLCTNECLKLWVACHQRKQKLAAVSCPHASFWNIISVPKAMAVVAVACLRKLAIKKAEKVRALSFDKPNIPYINENFSKTLSFFRFISEQLNDSYMPE